MTEISASAGVHSAYQHKRAGIGHSSACAGYGHAPVLDRLAQSVGNALGEFGKEEAFTRWCVEYNYDDALIGLAYDLTVGATGKASVLYADKIISRWNTEGCKTLADVNALLEKEKTEKAAKKPPKSAKEAEKDEMRSFEVEDFFAHALDRSYGKKD